LAGHDVVTIGASSGGVEALSRLVGGLPTDLPAAVLVVVHFPEGVPSALPRILNRAGSLEAVHPEDGDRVERGRVYVAPPGFHLLVEDGRVRLACGPKENGHRPAVDPLFRSAAVAYGPRVVGIVLTGADDDGAAGLAAIKRRGASGLRGCGGIGDEQQSIAAIQISGELDRAPLGIPGSASNPECRSVRMGSEYLGGR